MTLATALRASRAFQRSTAWCARYPHLNMRRLRTLRNRIAP
jgi:hypothetical protein